MRLPQVVRLILYPLSLFYGAAVKFRMGCYNSGKWKPKRLRAAVISVGNLTVGGTGKTPTVLWLAEWLLAQRKRVGILSRGYRGSGGSSDEVELLKARLGERVVFGVGADRFATGRKIEARTPVDVFLLDDGFQHRQVARDLDILMLDGSRRIRNEWLLPAGQLREPIAGCKRADVIVVSRKFERPYTEAIDAQQHAIFYAQTRLLGLRRFGGSGKLQYVSELGPKPLFAFCGIGNPDGFFSDLARWHVALAGKRAFRDHHKYSQKDLRLLVSAATSSGANALVTTEKDSYNLPAAVPPQLPIWIAVIDMVFTNESELLALVERRLAERRAATVGGRA